tara:strand:+ start:881 stop:1993 length:1113 start_codon:yes stop_codon:yes gene_type:complete
MKIAHFGAYGINIGDNIALYNVRKGIEESFGSPVEWTSVNILDFHETRNNIDFTIEQFKNISANNNALVIGGGGLLEGGVYNQGFETGYKLPFTAQTLEHLDIPIIVFSVGVNYFRMIDGFNATGVQALQSLVDRSSLFSVRNDGSKDSMLEMIPACADKIYEIPDPGLMYLNQSPQLDTIDSSKIKFQPAWNGDSRVLSGRFVRDQNLQDISRFVSEQKMEIVPHSPKDYSFLGLDNSRYVVSLEDFRKEATLEKAIGFLDRYLSYDAVIAMRGHGQLVSIGSNTPSLYLSTQDKVLNFSKKNGFEDYNIDILEYDWLGKLQRCYDKLLNDKVYLNNWYDIRNKMMPEYNSSYQNFCNKVSQILRNNND